MVAAGIGSFDLDLTSGHLSWDERLVQMFGHDLAKYGETIQALLGRVDPDDRSHVDAALHEAASSGADLRRRVPDRAAAPGDPLGGHPRQGLAD